MKQLPIAQTHTVRNRMLIVAWPYRSLDIVGSLALAVATIPVVLLAGFLVKLTSRGPVFYSQIRVGLGGEQFRIFKIRTMYDRCEAHSGVRWATRADTRITPVGRILRKLHIDELPQMWNIVIGDMSLVGPRPERPEIGAQLAVVIPDYPERISVRPGLTGLAQIQWPSDTSIETVRIKLQFDQRYIAEKSLWLDLRILAGTGLYLLGASYGQVRWLAGLPSIDGSNASEAAQQDLDADDAEAYRETSLATPCLEK